MWEQFKAWLETKFTSHRSEVRADVKAELADALKTNSTLTDLQGQLATAKSDLTAKTSAFDSLVGAIKSAIAANKVECKSEVPAEMLSAITAQAKADLSTAQTSISTISTALKTACATAKVTVADTATPAEMVSALSGAHTSLATDISANVTALRSHLVTVPGHDAYKEGGAKATATLADLVAAEQNATNTAMASLNIKRTEVPNAPATGGTTATAKDKSKMSLDERLAARAQAQ